MFEESEWEEFVSFLVSAHGDSPLGQTHSSCSFWSCLMRRKSLGVMSSSFIFFALRFFFSTSFCFLISANMSSCSWVREEELLICEAESLDRCLYSSICLFRASWSTPNTTLFFSAVCALVLSETMTGFFYGIKIIYYVAHFILYNIKYRKLNLNTYSASFSLSTGFSESSLGP